MAKSSKQDASLKYGWRSGLEEEIGKQLYAAGIPFSFEKLTIPFTPPVKIRHYTPDFLLLENGILIETKGRFLTADRQKHLAVKAEHPLLDLRFVFSNPNQKIGKRSKTTYAMWCRQKGFLCAARRIPHEWMYEPRNQASWKAIERLLKEQD